MKPVIRTATHLREKLQEDGEVIDRFDETIYSFLQFTQFTRDEYSSC